MIMMIIMSILSAALLNEGYVGGAAFAVGFDINRGMGHIMKGCVAFKELWSREKVGLNL